MHKKKIEAVCSSVLIEPKKAIRKFPRVQHLYARLRGRLQAEDDEIFSSCKMLICINLRLPYEPGMLSAWKCCDYHWDKL
ncbi:hypothetical protein HAX54_045145 [Datura stramonium]|uniref:Uncharacterized protein n=1 Tax=Datura stramonium TaxID=4076 RepID=A0ABS8WJE6_DATST|nr:hypothetical protein [Datura stramonium]